MGGRPERFELCRTDVTEVAVAAFDVVEVVDVIGHGGASSMVVAPRRHSARVTSIRRESLVSPG
jgi:hypothetical protein